jgi:hypothetical protein
VDEDDIEVNTYNAYLAQLAARSADAGGNGRNR